MLITSLGRVLGGTSGLLPPSFDFQLGNVRELKLLSRYGYSELKVSVIVALVSGVGVWAVARNGIHVGASGLVFGYFGYLVARGWYQRSFSSIVVAILVVFFYGGLIFGIVPSFGFVSWEGHLFGLLAGILAAKIIDEKKPSDGEQAAED